MASLGQFVPCSRGIVVGLDLSRDFSYFLYKSLCHRQSNRTCFVTLSWPRGSLSKVLAVDAASWRNLTFMLDVGSVSTMFSWPVWDSETQSRLLTLKSCLSCVRVGTSRKEVPGLLSNAFSRWTLSWRLDPVCWCPCPTGFWHQFEWTCCNDIKMR